MTIERLVRPDRTYTRAEVLARPSPASAAAGFYGWWFSRPPPGVAVGSCVQQDGLTLLYVGISPKRTADERARAISCDKDGMQALDRFRWRSWRG